MDKNEGYYQEIYEELNKSKKANHCNKYWSDQYKRITTNDFDSIRKRMTVLCKSEEKTYLLSKGAPNVILSSCSEILIQNNNNKGVRSEPLTQQMKDNIKSKINQWGHDYVLRCLGLAIRKINMDATEIKKSEETDMVLIGMIGMRDPPRPEVKNAINSCKAAGIKVIMVTGDEASTAEAIAKDIDIIDDYHYDKLIQYKNTYTGKEFESLNINEQLNVVDGMSVFARVEPHHKTQLVELLKSKGEIVAMTGDGVNDAPALKRSDIGVAMGSGTAVAKHAADMVLADDNFATIVSAVSEGNNLKVMKLYISY